MLFENKTLNWSCALLKVEWSYKAFFHVVLTQYTSKMSVPFFCLSYSEFVCDLVRGFYDDFFRTETNRVAQ